MEETRQLVMELQQTVATLTLQIEEISTKTSENTQRLLEEQRVWFRQAIAEALSESGKHFQPKNSGKMDALDAATLMKQVPSRSIESQEQGILIGRRVVIARRWKRRWMRRTSMHCIEML